MTERDGHVLIPIRDADAARAVAEATIVEAHLPPNPRRSPLDRVRERLRGRVPEHAVEALPAGYQQLGDVLLLRLPEPLLEHGPAIGRAYGEVLQARSVLHIEQATGELRRPRTRHLWGDEDTRTVHKEDGIAFHLDPSEVLFSPGNHHERHRLADAVEPGEHVVDCFAGIGYFTLPLARAGARVTACELNPPAVAYLEQNIDANGLADRVEVRPGDCREVAPTGVADRVMLGYFPGTARFLGCALRALWPEGGIIHYHTEVPAAEAEQAAWRELAGQPALAAAQPRLLASRCVKTTGPGHVHVVLDVEVEP